MVKRKLQELMEQKGLKVSDVAYHAKVSDAAIYNILNGADTRLSTLVRIARALGVSISSLIDEGDADQFLTEVKPKIEALDTVAA